MDNRKIYIIKNYINSNKYSAPPSDFVYEHYFIYNMIRNKLNINKNINPYKKIYLRRDNQINIDK